MPHGVRLVLDKAADRGERLAAHAFSSPVREAWYVAGFLAAALVADVLLRLGARLSR